MKRLEFSLPDDSERIKIIGKPRCYNPKKSERTSGEELYYTLRNNLPRGTYDGLEINMVGDLLARSCDIKDLQKLRDKIKHQMKEEGVPCIIKAINFYLGLEKSIELKK